MILLGRVARLDDLQPFQPQPFHDFVILVLKTFFAFSLSDIRKCSHRNKQRLLSDPEATSTVLFTFIHKLLENMELHVDCSFADR